MYLVRIISNGNTVENHHKSYGDALDDFNARKKARGTISASLDCKVNGKWTTIRNSSGVRAAAR